LIKSCSYAYCEFLENIPDRLSYNENHPERKAFYRFLVASCQQRHYELKPLETVARIFEDKILPSDDCPSEEILYLGLNGIEPNAGTATFTRIFGRNIISESKRFSKGDMLFGGLRPYLNKVHLVEIESGVGSGELFTMKPNTDLVLPQYLLTYLLSSLTLIQTKWILTGCSFPRLNPEDFKQLKIIVPKKDNEQKEILEKIEPFKTQVEQKQKSKDEITNNFRNLILNKLNIKMPTPHIFSDSIYSFYSDWINENTKRLDFIDHNPWMTKIRELLSSLQTIELGELIEPQIDYGITESGLSEGNTPFINIGELRLDGRIDTKNIGYINYEGNEKRVHKGDILISRSRLVGVCSLVSEKNENYSFGSYILRLKVKKNSPLPSEYIVNFLNSDLGQAQVRLLETGASGKNINTDQVKAIRIIQPSPEITCEVAEALTRVWRELDLLDKDLEVACKDLGNAFAKTVLGNGDFPDFTCEL
jgi:type I restriction enzyme S subunit